MVMSSSMRSNVLLAVAATLAVLVELEALLRLLDAVTAADIFADITLEDAPEQLPRRSLGTSCTRAAST
jgi:hypothetical protein